MKTITILIIENGVMLDRLYVETETPEKTSTEIVATIMKAHKMKEA